MWPDSESHCTTVLDRDKVSLGDQVPAGDSTVTDQILYYIIYNMYSVKDYMFFIQSRALHAGHVTEILALNYAFQHG